MTLKSTETMERITRQQLADNFDEILEKVNTEDIGYVILDNDGNDGQVLCPAKWFKAETDNIPSVMQELKRMKEETYALVEKTIKAIEDGKITDRDAIDYFLFMLMDYGDDVKFFELYRSLNKVIHEKFPQQENNK